MDEQPTRIYSLPDSTHNSDNYTRGITNDFVKEMESTTNNNSKMESDMFLKMFKDRNNKTVKDATGKKKGIEIVYAPSNTGLLIRTSAFDNDYSDGHNVKEALQKRVMN